MGAIGILIVLIGLVLFSGTYIYRSGLERKTGINMFSGSPEDVNSIRNTELFLDISDKNLKIVFS